MAGRKGRERDLIYYAQIFVFTHSILQGSKSFQNQYFFYFLRVSFIILCIEQNAFCVQALKIKKLQAGVYYILTDLFCKF